MALPTGDFAPPEPLAGYLHKEMSDVFGIHWTRILGYNRRTVQAGMPMTVKEMGRCARVHRPFL
jgi:hypothetical protein